MNIEMNDIVEVLKNTKKEDVKENKRLDNGMIKLLLTIGAVFLAFFIVFGTVFSSIYFKRLYWDFVGELSNSTIYAFHNEGVIVEDGADTYVIKGSKVYVFYKKLSNADFGRMQKKLSKDAESIGVDFGNGSSLRMWQAPMGENSRKIMYVHYTNADGRLYKCNVEGITLEDWRTFAQQNAN